MEARTRASLLWGVVGALVFLVGVQAYRLVTGTPVSLGVTFGVALLVGVVTTGVTYLLERRLGVGEPKEQS